jgi:hypothetical protein
MFTRQHLVKSIAIAADAAVPVVGGLMVKAAALVLSKAFGASVVGGAAAVAATTAAAAPAVSVNVAVVNALDSAVDFLT